VNRRRAAIVERLATFERVVEIGIGSRPAVATALADAGIAVTATDIEAVETPPAVAFVRDDITDPELAVYEGADALYALNLPPELHRPTLAAAADADADLLFTTLGGDPPAVPVDSEMLPGGETLFRARDLPASR
jgi:uncharacterized UPF0146 family protein